MRRLLSLRSVRSSGRSLACLLLGLWTVLLAGCATTDDAENLSERPWNAPKSWEGGLPAGMMEGR